MKRSLIHTSLALGLGIILALFLLWALQQPQAVHAAPDTRYVATTGTDSGNDCTDSSTPCRTVQHAVDEAVAGDDILVAGGVYTGVSVRETITQVVYISKTVTIRGGYDTAFTASAPDTYPTILDAQGQGRVVAIDRPQISPELESLRLTGGAFDGPGGGLYVNYPTVVISNCHIYSNTTSDKGGGVYFLYGDNSELVGNWIYSNTASSSAGDGGGLCLDFGDGVVLSDNRVFDNTSGRDGGGISLSIVRDSTLTANHVYRNQAGSTGDGGGLYAYSCHDSTLAGNEFYSNTGELGGGVYLHNGDHITLAGNSIYSNTALDSGTSGGGGLRLFSADDVTLIDNRLVNNTSSAYGGGMDATYSERLVMHGNTIAGNTATSSGGGIYLRGSPLANISGNAIYSNTASTGGGGGIRMFTNHTATLTSNVISGNVCAISGGGIDSYGSDGLTISGNQIHHNRIAHPLGSSEGGGGISVSSGEKLTLADNNIHHNECLDSSSLGGGLRLYGASNVTITRTRIYSNTCYESAGVNAFGSTISMANTYVADNRATRSSGIGSSTAGVRLSASGMDMTHATIARNTGVLPAQGLYVSGSSTLTMTNTILVGHAVGIEVSSGGAATLEATLWGTGTWANTTDWTGSGHIVTGTVNIWGAPAFADPDAGDYHITGASAARNAGVDAGVLDDVDGDSRLFAPPPDLGADEIVCLARVNDDPTEYTSVQAAVDAASDGDTVKVAGTCRGTQTRDGTAQVALVTQPLTIRGGYSGDFSTWDPDTYPTTLDAQREGRVLRIYGDMYAHEQITPVLESLRITRGYISGDSGGGIYSIYASTAISDCHIYANESSTTGGGAAFLYGWEISLTNNHIYSNTAGNSAGGVYFSDCDDTLLAGNWVYENAASLESGIYILDTSDALLVNNVVADNQSGNSAGSGLRFHNADARVLHTTVARNYGGKMGIDVSDSSSVWLTNTIVVSHYIGIYVKSGSAATLANTLWGAGSWANTFNASGHGTIVSSGSLSGDPSFVDYANGDYHITAASDALDQGIATWVSTDIDGHPRSVGAAPDLGADEVVQALEIAKSGPAWVNEGTPITYTLLITNAGAVASEDVLLTDMLPSGASFISASDGGSEAGGVVSWPTFDVPPGIVTRTFTVTATDTITNDDYAATPQPGFPAVGSVAVRTEINHAPVADAGVPQSVHAGTVTLDGSGSYDPDYGDQAYLWQQIGGPTSVAIDCPDCQTTFFDAPLLTGTYVFSFTDTDLYGLSDTDITTVTITNEAPLADAGTPQSVTIGTVTLDGSGSSDPESDSISFHWQQTGGPAAVTLNDADTMMATFTAPPTVGVYTFSLTVTDPFGADGADTTTVTITLPDLTITKSGPSEVAPGEPITYTLVVANNGTAAATSLVITDALPSGATFVTASDGGSLIGSTVTWSVPSLDAGGVVTLTLTITAPETVTNDDYRVSCAEGISAIGSTSVTTEVTKKVYLPLVTRNY